MIVLADPDTLPVNVKGTPRFDRRLEDKLLIAFTQAYEIGERDIARRLLAMLREFRPSWP